MLWSIAPRTLSGRSRDIPLSSEDISWSWPHAQRVRPKSRSCGSPFDGAGHHEPVCSHHLVAVLLHELRLQHVRPMGLEGYRKVVIWSNTSTVTPPEKSLCMSPTSSRSSKVSLLKVLISRTCLWLSMGSSSWSSVTNVSPKPTNDFLKCKKAGGGTARHQTLPTHIFFG